MAFLNNLGSFAGGLAQGIDQGQIIALRKQQAEQQKLQQQLEMFQVLQTAFKEQNPAMRKAMLQGLANAMGVDIKDNPAFAAMEKAVAAADEDQLAAWNQMLETVPPEMRPQLMAAWKMSNGDIMASTKLMGAMSDAGRQYKIERNRREIGSYLGEDRTPQSIQKAIDMSMAAGDMDMAKQLQEMLPKPGEAFTLSPGETRYNAGGQPIASVPPKPDDTTRAGSELQKLLDEQRKYAPGSREYDLYEKKITNYVNSAGLGEALAGLFAGVPAVDGVAPPAPTGAIITTPPVNPVAAQQQALPPEAVVLPMPPKKTAPR